jgi:hypothetical protein
VEILTHPFFLLVVGGLITGGLFPLLARQWQDQKQLLEVKASLVAEMSESVTAFLTRIGTVRVYRSWLPPPELREEQPEQAESVEKRYREAFDEMNERYYAFQLTSAVIGVKLRVFFPAAGIEERWRGLAELVSNVYALEGIFPPERRRRWQEQVREKLLELRGADERIAPEWGEDNERWAAVQSALLDVQSGLIGDILREPARPLRPRRWLPALPSRSR